MQIQRFYVNPFQEACYVVSGAAGMHDTDCILIDCGAYYPEEEDTIRNYIRKEGLTPVAHLLTHAHLDHIFGSQFVYSTWGLRPIVHEADSGLFSSLENQARMFGISLMREPLQEHLTLASLPPFVRFIHTPGHTPGSVCYLLKDSNNSCSGNIDSSSDSCSDSNSYSEVLFSGDTLFQSGIGRTDLPGGNYGQLMSSLAQLAQLAPTTRVLPGHGGITTIGQEIEENPYL